ncbi:HalOD1 output domain-containing protein [Halovenus sp. HT40]|uniref:HalOD1 output domain-containing protein n=1 Tax=Halovenus sp. HT40 TaxID=3126691 RepID=UPI00300F1804
MTDAQKISSSVDITDSIDSVCFDADDELFHATYDSARDSTTVAVVAVVAAALGTDPCALSPLQSTLDTDALDDLVSEPRTENYNSISFSYEAFEVTVTSRGAIVAEPTEHT